MRHVEDFAQRRLKCELGQNTTSGLRLRFSSPDPHWKAPGRGFNGVGAYSKPAAVMLGDIRAPEMAMTPTRCFLKTVLAGARDRRPMRRDGSGAT